MIIYIQFLLSLYSKWISVSVAAFLAGGSVQAENLSALHSKQIDPELPFEPFPSQVEYSLAEAPYSSRASQVEYNEAEAPFAGQEMESEPVYSQAEAPFVGREVEIESEFNSAETPFRGRELANEPELSQPRLSNGVNPQAPFAEGKPSNEGNSEKPFEEENESSENESIPWTKLRPATPIEEAKESIPWTELSPATPVEETVDPKVFAANQGMESGSLDSLGRPVDGLIINVENSLDHLAKEDADSKYQKALDAKKVPMDSNGNISQGGIRRRNFYQSGDSFYMIPLSEDFVNEWNQPNNPVFDHVLYQNEMLKLVNELRESKGLNTLTYNSDVQYGADTRAIEAGHKFDHVRPNGESWKTAFDEEDQEKEWSENIAAASYTANPYEAVSEKLMAERLFDLWVSSPGHYANMIAPQVTKMVTSIRVTEAEDSQIPGQPTNVFYGVQNFGI